MANYKTRTMQQDALSGSALGPEVHRGTRIGYTAQFGRDVVTSASYAAIESDFTNPNANNVDNDFVLSGENPAAAAGSRGNVVLTAQSSDSAYGVFIKPRTNSRFANTKWDTSLSPVFECVITTGAQAVAGAAVQAGLMLTGAMNLTTDADQVKFFYNDTYTTWQVAVSNATNDYVVDTGVTVAASTTYHLVINVGADRTATCAINGKVVGPTEALDATTDLIPIVGVASDGGAADALLSVHSITVLQDIA
jgi:hypothetical protein